MDNLTLRDFIEKREAEIREQRTKLLAELRELRAAKLAIESTTIAKQDGETSKPTIKEMVIKVLEENKKSANADQIATWIQARFSEPIPRSSLSPQLSRLKKDNKVTLDDETGLWSLFSASRESEIDDILGDDEGGDLV